MATPKLEALRAQAIQDCCRDFRDEVTKTADIIIREVHIDDPSEKTIPPAIDMGGQAGGEKFVHNSILYKFARDWRGIYAGQGGAMKAAGCELRGLHAIAALEFTNSVFHSLVWSTSSVGEFLQWLFCPLIQILLCMVQTTAARTFAHPTPR